MLCSKCGAENPDDSEFCQGCGESLAAAASEPKTKSEPKSGKKSKAKAKPKRSTPSGDSAPKGTSKNLGGFTDMLDKLPVGLILLISAAVCLAFALLSGLLAAIGADDIFDNGSYATSHFFDRMVLGIFIAGVLVGLSAIVSRK